MTCNCIGGNPCPCRRAGQPLLGNIAFGPLYTGAQPHVMSEELLDLLEKAKLHVMTPKEIYEQKISWLRGMSGKLADPMPSREQIVKALEEMGVVDPEKASSSAAGDEQPTKEKS